MLLPFQGVFIHLLHCKTRAMPWPDIFLPLRGVIEYLQLHAFLHPKCFILQPSKLSLEDCNLFFPSLLQQKHEFVGLKCILKQGFQLSKSTFSPRFLAHKETAEIAKIAHFIEKFGTFRAADFQKSNKSNKSNKQNRETKFVLYIHNKLSQ